MKTAIRITSGLLSIGLLLICGAYLANGPLGNLLPGASSRTVEIKTSEIVQAVTQTEQVVLLSLAIEGMDEQVQANENFFGLFEVPGTNKAKYIKYSFDAKLGLDGSEVKIHKVGDKEFLISVPEFIFIGHDDVEFSLAAEKNGALSWFAPKNSEDLDIATSILNSDSRKEYIERYEDLLKDQAQSYYRQIISGIDPTVVVAFEFQEEKA